MKRLTAREEEIMGYFWTKGPLFVKQLLEFYDEPRPHFNTLSTIVRGLEEKGFLAHHTFGNTYQYYAAVTEADYSRSTLKNVIANQRDQRQTFFHLHPAQCGKLHQQRLRQQRIASGG